MAKEIYLYSEIYDFVAESIMEKMEDAADEDIVMRINSPGGQVFSGWGIVAKIKEHAGSITGKVDGAAISMSALILLYFDSVEAMDVSRIMLHRAHMFVENAEDQKFLDSINADIKKQLTKKVDSKKFKEITGFTINDMFNSEERKDVWLTADQAKQIGLVQKVTKLTPAAKTEIAAINDKFYNIAAKGNPNPNPMQDPKMTVDELKSKQPELFDSISKSAIIAERDRVGALLAYIDADKEVVLKAVKDGDELSQTMMAELNIKLVNAGKLDKLNAGNPPTPKATDKPEEEAEEVGKVYVEVAGKKVELTAEEAKLQMSSMQTAIENAKKGIKIN